MSTILPILEKRPTGAGWSWFEPPIYRGANASGWLRGNFRILSQIDNIELPKGGIGPQWIVSISRRGRRRPTVKECRRLLRHFGMGSAEEDNHEKGIARKFWLPVDPAERVDCECKVDEEQVVEADGYTWSRPREKAS